MGTLHGEAKSKRFETMEYVYELFPRMKERRKQMAGTLSGGEQQMLAVGRGLMSLPKLMMFDEPSLGLAPILPFGRLRLAYCAGPQLTRTRNSVQPMTGRLGSVRYSQRAPGLPLPSDGARVQQVTVPAICGREDW